MIACHTLQGTIQDIGGILGGSVAYISETAEKMSSTNELPLHVKKQLYKIYRYLNVVHIFCYEKYMDCFKKHHVIDQLQYKLELLTEEEAVLFHSMETKEREGMCALLYHEAALLLNDSEMKHTENTLMIVKTKISEMRGVMGRIHGMYDLLFLC